MEQKPQRDWLQKIEYIGNKLPDITILFVYALAICWLLSWGLWVQRFQAAYLCWSFV